MERKKVIIFMGPLLGKLKGKGKGKGIGNDFQIN